MSIKKWTPSTDFQLCLLTHFRSFISSFGVIISIVCLITNTHFSLPLGKKSTYDYLMLRIINTDLLLQRTSFSRVSLSYCLKSWLEHCIHKIHVNKVVNPVLSTLYFGFFKLLIYFWLCWVFTAVHWLSLVVACGGHSPVVVCVLLVAVAFAVAKHRL